MAVLLLKLVCQHLCMLLATGGGWVRKPKYQTDLAASAFSFTFFLGAMAV